MQTQPLKGTKNIPLISTDKDVNKKLNNHLRLSLEPVDQNFIKGKPSP